MAQNNPGSRLEWMRANAPIVSAVTSLVSCIAAAASAFAAAITVYAVFLKPPNPFDAKVTFGTPIFENQVEKQGQKQVEQLSAALTLAVTNSGGLPGRIDDIALRVKSTKTGHHWDLVPVFFGNLESYLRGAGGKENMVQATTSSFSAITLTAKGSGSFTVFFLPKGDALLTIKDLNQDEVYDVVLYIRDDQLGSADQKWKLAAKSQYSFKKDMLDGLRSGLLAIPVERFRDEFSDKLPQD